MASDLIHVDDNGVLTLTLSTAAAGTSLDHGLVLEARDTLRAVVRGAIDADAVLLRGDGKNFCAGGNVAKFGSADDRSDYLRGLADDLHSAIGFLYETQLPVVAAVKGWAAGAGMSLVLHADVAIGGPATKMRPAYPGIGLSPDGGMSWQLPRVVGAARARYIIMTDQILDADQALSMGILSEIVDDDAVEQSAYDLAAQLAAGPRGSHRAIRTLVHESATRSLTDHLAAEAATIAGLSVTAEGVEGVDAFLAKRKADYRGVR
ncbi:enoyl-CoA hydratase/isomerase family protein [Gordonia phthalatica]|uniref:Enoyl-CoA hydratase n=1 Tax=Gordonia phthalatica TaxID=1136941 RepID=A0A0N9NHT4_9ACTN|nr:enoyl-CoA hydratase-related protein [Gordonia phthalatica]ALG85387.1 enoyl-CoA hydratase [Gordonia phthalatica]